MWNKIKDYIGNIVLIFIVIIFGVFLFKKKDPEIIRTRIIMEIPVPGKIGVFQPSLLPTPKKEKSRPKLVEEFKKATEEGKDSLYADAVTERTYDTIYKDSTIAISIEDLVQGRLLKQSVSYEIFPSTVKVDTVIPVEIKTRNKFYVGGGIGMPITPSGSNITGPILQGNLMFQNKKENIWSLAVTTEKNIMLGYAFKIKL